MTAPLLATRDALFVALAPIHEAATRAALNREGYTLAEAVDTFLSSGVVRDPATLADAWDEGFTRGFYDVLAGGSRDASESAAENPYRTEDPA